MIAGAVASFNVTALVGPHRPSFSLHRQLLKRLMLVGMPMTVASAAGSSMGAWPTLVGHAELPTDVFATYAVQARLAGAVYGATVGFVLVFDWPQAKKHWDTSDPKAAAAVVDRYARYIMVLGSAGVVLFWVLGDVVTRLILGPVYAATSSPRSPSPWPAPIAWR